MHFPTISYIRSLHFAPNKNRGQNFLIDRHIAERTVLAAGLSPADTVIEIGPGLGSLTFFLHAMNIRSHCYEIDAALYASLNDSLPPDSSVRLYHRDILDVSLGDIDRSAVLIGSIPYALTTPILLKYFEECGSIRRAVFIVQQEVADRLCAAPGTRACGILSLYSAAYAPATRLFPIPPEAFYPVPAVASTCVLVTPDPRRHWSDPGENFFRMMLRCAFSHRRKKLHNALQDFLRRHGINPEQAGSTCAAQGLDLSRRPETLTLDEWYRLAAVLHSCARMQEQMVI